MLANGEVPGRIFSPHPSLAHPQLKAYPFGFSWSRFNHNPPSAIFTGQESERSHRTNLLNCDFIGHPGYCNRQVKLNVMEANGHKCKNEGTKTNWPEYMGAMMNAQFAASPAGGGLQNHRDIEAAVSGAVLVVEAANEHAVFAPLKEGLPAIFVSDWSQLTPAYLKAMEAAKVESFGDCKMLCEGGLNEEAAPCKACLAKVSVPGYCAGHPGTPGC